MTCNLSTSFYAVTYENVTAILSVILPQYSSIETSTVELYYKILYVQISQKSLGLNSNIAFANLMAHYLVLVTDPAYAAAGVFNQKKLGEAGITYNNAGYNSATNPMWQDLKRTPYGITYWGIISKTVFPAIVSTQSTSMGGEPISLPPPPYGVYGYGYGGLSGYY